MSYDILRVRDFDPSKTILTNVEGNAHGGKGAYINYEGMSKFRLQLPRMLAPFGLGCYEDDRGVKKYSVDLSFGKSENRGGVLQIFHEKLTEWDDSMVKLAHENCVSWFKKPKKLMTENVLRKNYSALVNRYKDENGDFTELYPDRVKIKIPYWDGKFNVKVYNEKQEVVSPEYITKFSEVIAVVRNVKLWVSGDKFGIILNADQLQVFPAERLTGFSMLPDLESESSEGPAEPAEVAAGGEDAEEPAEDSEEGEEMSVSESDEESDEEDEEPEAEPSPEPSPEPEPEPEPEPKKAAKKRGRKRASSKTPSKKSRFEELSK